MTSSKALSPQQVRQRLRAQGKTLSQWARERNYRLQAVYRVMGGQDKAHYGKAHEIAVALGLKVPPADEGNTPNKDRNTPTRAAA